VSDVRAYPEPISASDVRRYCEATGDENPLWRDDAGARAAGYRGQMVPPVLVASLTRRLPQGDSEEDRVFWQHQVPVLKGYTNTRNAGTELEFLAPIYVGDRITVQTRLVAVEARQGRTGLGIYVRRILEFRNQDGELVIRRDQTLAKFPPSTATDAPRASDDG
jgi:acyl dehydratase